MTWRGPGFQDDIINWHPGWYAQRFPNFGAHMHDIRTSDSSHCSLSFWNCGPSWAKIATNYFTRTRTMRSLTAPELGINWTRVAAIRTMSVSGCTDSFDAVSLTGENVFGAIFAWREINVYRGRKWWQVLNLGPSDCFAQPRMCPAHALVRRSHNYPRIF